MLLKSLRSHNKEEVVYEEVLKRAKVILNSWDSGKISTVRCYSLLYDVLVDAMRGLCYSREAQIESDERWEQYKNNVGRGM